MSSAFGVVLDANVLIPMAVCDTLIRTAQVRMYRPHWTATILDETERNLVKKLGITPASAQRRRQRMEAALPHAMTVDYENLLVAMTNDPKDRHVLAAAVHAGAQVIVTENLRDFPAAACGKHNVEARSTDQFLSDLLDMDPEIMFQVICEQASDLKAPAQSIEQVLVSLARIAPEFARDAFHIFDEISKVALAIPHH